MYFTSVRLVGLNTVNLPIVGAVSTDKYITQNIEGLGPAERDVFVSTTTRMGGVYQGRRALSREIVLLVGLHPDWPTGETASDMREELYGLFEAEADSEDEDAMLFQLMNGAVVVAQVTGYLKRIEINPFTADPQVQIVIPCPDAYLTAPAAVTVDTGTLDKLSPVIENPGSARSGFYMELAFTAATDDFALRQGTKSLWLDEPFLSGDVLKINTIPGSRSLLRVRAGSTVNMMRHLASGSFWPYLRKGTNTFTVFSEGIAFDDFNWNSVYYTPLYEGI